MLTGSGSNRTTEDEDEVADFWSKCMPMLLFGLVACALNKSQLSSLDFTINRFFMKLFQTNSIEIVRACQESFGFEVPSVLLKKEWKN